MAVVDRDFSLLSVVGTMLDCERHLSAMVSFCELVIALYEIAE